MYDPKPKYFWSSDYDYLVSDCCIGKKDEQLIYVIRFIRLKDFEIVKELSGKLIDYDPANKILLAFENNPNPVNYPFVVKYNLLEKTKVTVDSTNIPSRGYFPKVSMDKEKREIWISFFDRLNYEEIVKRDTY